MFCPHCGSKSLTCNKEGICECAECNSAFAIRVKGGKAKFTLEVSAADVDLDSQTRLEMSIITALRHFNINVINIEEIK